MMSGLLIYSYATGVFGSRRIEQTSYENVAVRLPCGDTHPDHKSPGPSGLRQNGAAILF